MYFTLQSMTQSRRATLMWKWAWLSLSWVLTVSRSSQTLVFGSSAQSTVTAIMGVTNITNLDQFNKALKDAGDKLVVVDFTASWCGPCKKIGPIFKEQADLPVNSNVVFLVVDVDVAADVSEKCGIKAMPTFFYYKNEKKVDELTGANDAKLISKLASLRT